MGDGKQGLEGCLETSTFILEPTVSSPPENIFLAWDLMVLFSIDTIYILLWSMSCNFALFQVLKRRPPQPMTLQP